MVMYRLLKGFLAPRPASDVPDAHVDFWIREALLDDSLAQPPAGAWERLYKAIIEHRLSRNYGMWVLDEPFRDPPPAAQGMMSEQQFLRALRIHDDRNVDRRLQFRVGDAMWSHLVPTFPLVMNL